MTSQQRQRNERGSGRLLRDEIVAAAERLIEAADDPDAVTLRAVAREAHISAPSIYGHFADLQGVLDAVLERSFADLDRAVASALDEQADPVERVVAGCLAYVRFGWAHRARYRFMFRGSGYAPEAFAILQRIEAAVAECAASGRSGSVDPAGDAFLLWVAMHGMADLEKPDRAELRRLGELDRTARTRELVAQVALLR